MITANYRQDYHGEFVVLETRWKDGIKTQKKEWIDNPITNQHISDRAAVIGSRSDKDRFDYTRLQRHRGGLLGKKKLQTYASGQLWTDMPFDFFVTGDNAEILKIMDNNYDDPNIVYSTARLCINYPGHFYLVPYAPQVDQLSLAVYLSAFDGHREIFLLGYSNDTPASNRHWVDHVDYVFRAFRSTAFYLVGTESNMPVKWRHNKNVECMNYRQFISTCDI
jgi:hypothetical protein